MGFVLAIEAEKRHKNSVSANAQSAALEVKASRVGVHPASTAQKYKGSTWKYQNDTNYCAAAALAADASS